MLYRHKRWTPERIAILLNDEGVPGPSAKGKWGKEAVRRFILRPAEPPAEELTNEPTKLPSPLKIARNKM